MTFTLYAFRFGFRALEQVDFPPGRAGNVFRGAFGTIFRRIACVPTCPGASSCPEQQTCPYARMFEPALQGGPSGLADPPRPFVLRASHLDRARLGTGDRFHADVHMFGVKDPALAYFTLTFAQLTREGLGPRRGRVGLESVDAVELSGEPSRRLFDGGTFRLESPPEPLVLDLQPAARNVQRVEVSFLTPTELKGSGDIVRGLPFGVLFARIRDRVSTLRALYSEGPLEIDFRGMGERARAVRTVLSDLRFADVQRRSSRTGAVHGIGGFVGRVEYEGELGEFVPFLEAARWVGVGRHTVWGNGVLSYRIP